MHLYQYQNQLKCLIILQATFEYLVARNLPEAFSILGN